MLCYVMLCYVMLRYVTLRYVTLRHVILYYIILYYIILHYIILYYTIHLLDRTETNIIFIWSGKVILGEAKPSPNITSPDQINMILGEVLSNKCFIIPATLCAPGPSHVLLIQTKRPFTTYHAVRPCKSLRIASFIFERRILLRSNWLPCDEIKSVLSET